MKMKALAVLTFVWYLLCINNFANLVIPPPSSTLIKMSQKDEEKGWVVCPQCKGKKCEFCKHKGGFALVRCPDCKGRGMVKDYIIEQREPGKEARFRWEECEVCHGRRKILIPSPNPIPIEVQR